MNTQSYLDMFEFQEEKHPSGAVKRAWWSFKLGAINSQNEKYLKLSEVIRNSDLDNDSSYSFTVEALEAIKDLINIDPASPVEGLTGEETLDGYAEAPIYNNELTEWFAKGNNYVFVDEVLKEYGNDIYNEQTGILGIIGLAYSDAWKEHYYKVLEAVKD